MKSSISNKITFITKSLRVRVAVFVIIPIIISFMLLSINHFFRERAILRSQFQETAALLSDVTYHSMKHVLMNKDSVMTQDILRDVTENETILKVKIVTHDGVVLASSIPGDAGLVLNPEQIGCFECHQYAGNQMPRAIYIPDNSGFIRVSTHVRNDPACQECHPAEQSHLGIILIDTNLVASEENIIRHLAVDLIASFVISVFILFASYLLFQWFVVRRIENIYQTLVSYTSGNLSARVPILWRFDDEISQLRDTFNQMADSIERHRELEREQYRIRQEAIIEERERIARELHDGVAQMLGYINTKLTTIRLYLEKKQFNNVREHIDQIEKVVLDQSVDVRSSILGLKLTGQNGQGLSENIHDYVSQCNKISDLNLILEITPEAEKVTLNPEKELQLMRILQESVSNIRKHASADEGQIRLFVEDYKLSLSICDNGIGFDPWNLNLSGLPHFGIQTMRERAEAIGATFNIQSVPDYGTCVHVTLDLENK